MQSTRSTRLLSLARRFVHIRTAAQATSPLLAKAAKDAGTSSRSAEEQTTHFGYQTVRESEKEQKGR